MKVLSRGIVVTVVALLVGACGNPLSKEKKAEAEALIMTNVLCEVVGMYRISTMKLNLMHPQKHQDMANEIYDGAGLSGFSGAKAENIDDLRGQLDIAIKGDIQEISMHNQDRQKINRAVEMLFAEIQASFKKKYGYAYPDCEMAYSMSEAFLAQDL